MVSSIREAKAKLSELVQKAADGEEVVITVRGEPSVRLIPIVNKNADSGDRKKWVDELATAAKAASVDSDPVTSQEFWDDLRSDRF